jgi:hypothetical protein
VGSHDGVGTAGRGLLLECELNEVEVLEAQKLTRLPALLPAAGVLCIAKLDEFELGSTGVLPLEGGGLLMV